MLLANSCGRYCWVPRMACCEGSFGLVRETNLKTIDTLVQVRFDWDFFQNTRRNMTSKNRTRLSRRQRRLRGTTKSSEPAWNCCSWVPSPKRHPAACPAWISNPLQKTTRKRTQNFKLWKESTTFDSFVPNEKFPSFGESRRTHPRIPFIQGLDIQKVHVLRRALRDGIQRAPHHHGQSLGDLEFPVLVGDADVLVQLVRGDKRVGLLEFVPRLTLGCLTTTEWQTQTSGQDAQLQKNQKNL